MLLHKYGLPRLHAHSPSDLELSGVQWGLDLVKGELRDNVEAGVLEPTMNKVKIVQFATEAALTVLRIDDMIKIEKDPAEEEG